ncbi:alpha/beta hydrolase [Spirillospora sp. NPDC052269]
MRSEIPVVLVHGSWHGAWCWTPVIEELAGRGVRPVAVDLDGHGLRSRSPRARWARPRDAAAFAVEPSPVADVTASSAAATLVGRIRRIGGGRPCLLVAHSMGGVVATAAAELAPELVAGLLYVAALAPVAGLPAGVYNTAPENAGELLNRLLMADHMAIGAVRIDPGDPEQHEMFRETFYADVDADTAAAAIAMLNSDAPLGIPVETLTVTASRYGSLPHSYVACLRDNAVPIALQRRFVKEIDAVSDRPTTVTELDASHSPFLSQPARLAEIIATTRVAGE